MSEPSNQTLTPAGAPAFEQGPPLTPGAALLAWLNENGGTPAQAAPRPRLRVPVVLRFSDEHRLEIGDAWIGLDTGGAAPADAIHLELDDTALGVAVIDTARRLCAAGTPGCGVLLEGVWGRIVELPIPLPPAPGPKRWPFGITRVAGAPAGASAPEATHLGVAR